MKRPFPPVIVTWTDAVSHVGQHTMGDAAKLPLRIRRTIGWLIGKDKIAVRLAHDYDPPDPHDDEGVGHVTVIPAGWVKEIKHI